MTKEHAMTASNLPISRLLCRRGLAAALSVALAAGAGAAAFAQGLQQNCQECHRPSGSESEEARESQEKERAVRVMVLGDGQIEIIEDSDDSFPSAVRLLGSASEKAREMAGRVRPISLHWGGAYLGVELVNLNEPLRAHFGVPEGSGVLVSNVVDGSPAARAGVQVGDIVTRFDGEDVTSSRKLTTMVRKAEAGDPADLEVWRDGKVETLSTTLDERPQPDLRANYFSFLRGSEDLDGDGEIDVFVSPENVHEKIQEYFDGDEWKERHEHLQRFLHERRPDMRALEERLESLKERLAELESRLEERAEEN